MKQGHSCATPVCPGHCRRLSGHFVLHPLAFALACLVMPEWALALPEGFNPVSGLVNQNLATPGVMNLQQGSDRAIVNWNSFNIGPTESVNISQPNANSAMLNRVTGGVSSSIAGSLTANGRVFLVNPSGVVFRAGSRVSTGGLVASTLDISDDDFNNGRWNFSRAAGNQAAVTNLGDLQAGPGGTIALMGAVVRNEGSIKADGGTAALVSARQVSLDFFGDGLTNFTVPQSGIGSQALVENTATGLVQADGGRVKIFANSNAVAPLVVNQQGVLRARSLEQHGGEIILAVATMTNPAAVGGNRVEIGGTLDASSIGSLPGGHISIAGAGLYLNDTAVLDVNGASGAGRIDLVSTESVALATGSSLTANALVNGNGGTLNLQGGRSLTAHGSLQARGAGSGAGGTIETSALAVNLAGLRVDAAGAIGNPAGTWLIDPVNIRISHDSGDGCCLLENPFDLVVAANSVVLDSAVNASLNNGSSVRIHTTPINASDVGSNIVIDEGVSIHRAQGGAPVELRFEADDGIAGSNFSIVSDLAPLGVVFNANANESRATGGRIVLNSAFNDNGTSTSRSIISTHGGSIAFFGGKNPDKAVSASAIDPEIFLGGIDINTSGVAPVSSNSVFMRGYSDGSGIELDDVGIHIGNGDLILSGGSPEGSGIILVDSNVLVDKGSVTIGGEGGAGVEISSSEVHAVEGDIEVAGSANKFEGVLLSEANISADRGNINVSGNAFAEDGVVSNAEHFGINVDGSVVGVGDGNVTMSGFSSDTAGVHFADTNINVNNGSVEIVGSSGANDGTNGIGVRFEDGAINIGSGKFILSGLTDGSSGVFLQNASVNVKSGSIQISGASQGGGGGNTMGLQVEGSRIHAGGGDVVLSGNSIGDIGVLLFESNVAVDGGNISVVGSGSDGGGGIEFNSGDVSAVGGGVSLTGSSDSDIGVYLGGFNISASQGSISITGTTLTGEAGVEVDGVLPSDHISTVGGNVTLVGLAGQNATAIIDRSGLILHGNTNITTDTGNISLLGRVSSAEGGAGILFDLDGGELSIKSQTGDINLAGEATGRSFTSGLLVVKSSPEATGTVSAGNRLDIRAAASSTNQLAFDLGDMSLTGIVQTSLRPGGVDVNGKLTDNNTTPIQLGDGPDGFTPVSNFIVSQATVDQITTPRLVIGSELYSASIVGVGSLTVGSNKQLTLLSEGSGGSIDLRAPLTVTNGTLSLLADGQISQSTTGTLTSEQLLAISHSGNVLLNNRANAPHIIAGRAAGDFSFTNVDDLSIGTVEGTSGVQAGTVSINTLEGKLSVDQAVTATAGRAALDSAATLDVNAPVSVANGTLALSANGQINQNDTGTLTSEQLLAISRNGNVLLTNPVNASHVVAGSAAQAFAFIGAGNLNVGTVGGTSGVQAGTVALRNLAGDMSLDQAVTATAGRAVLDSAGAIAVNAPVSVPNGTLSLTANGQISQTDSGAMTSEQLLAVSRNASVLLNNSANAPHVVAGRAAGDFAFTNADNLSIGTVDGVSGVQAGTVFIRNLDGDLILDQPVTATAGSAVLVTGGRLQNPAGQTISASTLWQIWANTWIGENRGGLVGSGRLANLYGCAFGGNCASAAGLATTAGDNHFLYLQQPTAQITIASGSGPFGVVPQFQTSISGLILGDSGNGISGSPDSAFSQIARPGTFSVGGTFTSAEGYLLTVVPGTWTNYLFGAVDARPDWTRERPDTWLYDHNMGGSPMCAAPGVTVASAVQQGDVLAREWSLVKSRPKLSSCVASDKQNGCSDF